MSSTDRRKSVSLASCLSSLADERQLLHTNTPSVPGQRETNDIGLAATNKGYTRKGA